MVVDMWQSVGDLDLIFPGCSVVCEPASLLSAAWGIPVVSYACSASSLSDKSIYPYFTRVVEEGTAYGTVLSVISTVFKWDRIGILTTDDVAYSQFAVTIKKELERNGKTVIFRLAESSVQAGSINEENLIKQREVLKQFKDEAKIILMTTFGHDVRNILISAYEENMLNGNYVFIGIEINYIIFDKFEFRPELDSVIYSGLLDINPKVPSGEAYDKFRREVIEAFQDPRFRGWPHLSLTADIEEVNLYAGQMPLLVIWYISEKKKCLSSIN